MITIEKILWSLIKFSQLIVKGNVWRSVWRICMWILGLKGLMLHILSRLGSFAVICVNIDVRDKLIQHTTHSINDPVAYCRWHSHRITSWINQSNCNLVKVIMKQFKTEAFGISLASNYNPCYIVSDGIRNENTHTHPIPVSVIWDFAKIFVKSSKESMNRKQNL